MINQHCNRKLTTVEDSCIAITKACKTCKERFTQKKRRPKDALPDECTWHKTVFCPAHPDTGGVLIP